MTSAGYSLERGDIAALVLRVKKTGACYSLKGLLGRDVRERDMLACFSPEELQNLPMSKPSPKRKRPLKVRQQIARSRGAFQKASKPGRMPAPMVKIADVSTVQMLAPEKSKVTCTTETHSLPLSNARAKDLPLTGKDDFLYDAPEESGDAVIDESQRSFVASDEELRRTLAGNEDIYNLVVNSRIATAADRKLAASNKILADKLAVEKAQQVQKAAKDKADHQLKKIKDNQKALSAFNRAQRMKGPGSV